MNSFSFNRFGKTLRWVMAVNFRTLLMWTIGSVVAVFVGELMTAEIGRYSADEMVRLYGTMGCVLFILVSLIMASTIVSSVNEKRKRQAFLMIPSTNLEKFLSLLVYTSVICVACVLLAFVLGDCLRMAWFWIKIHSFSTEYQVSVIGDPAETYHGWSSALPKLIENLTPNVLDPDSSVPFCCRGRYITLAYSCSGVTCGKTEFITNRKWAPWPMCSQSCCLHLPSSTTGHHSISSSISN